MIWLLGTPGTWYMGEWYGGAAPPPLTPSFHRRRFGLGLGSVVHRSTTRP